MSAIIEVVNPTDANDSGFVILGLSGKFFDNANTKSYDVTIKKTLELDALAATPANAYPEMTNSIDEVEGKCVVITRGTNTFTSKYEQAMHLNAACVIIANNNNAQPASILTLYGQISDECFQEHRDYGDSFPPCIMISYDSHSFLLKQFHSNPVIKLRMRPVAVSDLSLLALDDIGVIIRSSCIFDNHPLLLESLSFLFHKTSLSQSAGSTLSVQLPSETQRLDTVGRIIGDVEVGRGANPLHLAVEQNNLPCLATLLRTSLSTEIRKDDGYTGLHLATEHGRYDAVALLLASGAYIDHPHPIGWTALHFAVYCEHLSIVTLLCEQGASVNAMSIDGNSPLHVAAKIGADSCLRKMLEYSVADIFRSSGPLTVLQCAQQNNQMGCCRILHEYGKKIKSANPAGQITWSRQSSNNAPIQIGGDNQLNNEKINVLGVSSNPSMLLIDHWFQCCNISAQNGIINLSITSSAGLDENTQQLLALDLERCCFPEYRHGAKCKLLKNVVVTLLSGCKTITYRQGMMSLLIPIIEANFYSKSYHLNESQQGSSHTVEANVVNKTVLMFHTIINIFPTIGNYYSISESKRSTAIPQLTCMILPLLRFHYPMIYTALVWNEISLLVFIVPWISTMMAHVLSLKETMRLWSALFEMYSAKRLLLKSAANSGSNSASSTPRGTPKSPRSSATNCDIFLVYLVVASLKSLENHMLSSTTATTLISKESLQASYTHSRSDSRDLSTNGSADTALPAGSDNSIRKLLETKLTSAVQTASSAVESLSLMSTPRGAANLLVTKSYSVQSDEHILQLLTGINNATSLMQEMAEKKSHTEMNILGYIDGRGAGDSSTAFGSSPNLLTSLGNMLNATTSTGNGSGGNQNNSAVGDSSGKGSGGSNSTVQQLLSMYYNSSSAASGTGTPSKGSRPGSKPTTPIHHSAGSSTVMLHVSAILPIMDKMVRDADINNLIVSAQASSRSADEDNDLSMWESFTHDISSLDVLRFMDMLTTRLEVDLNYHFVVLEVSPDCVPFANFQSAVPALHSYHHKRHSAKSKITSQIEECLKSLNVDNEVDVFHLDQLQIMGLVDYVRNFAVSIGTRVMLNKKPKDEYMKLSTLPNLPPFLRNLIGPGTATASINRYVVIVPSETISSDAISGEFASLLSSIANTLTICGVEQVVVLSPM